jgi:hypothetical protein
MEAIGRRRWAIAEGYIPSESAFSDRALISHETACILNTGDRDARIEITIMFADREPVGPYRVTVGAHRTLHLRFNDLKDPKPVPRDTDYASIFESDVPIVVQHTRLDSRRAELALLSTRCSRRWPIRRVEARIPHFAELLQRSGVHDWPDRAVFPIPRQLNGVQ